MGNLIVTISMPIISKVICFSVKNNYFYIYYHVIAYNKTQWTDNYLMSEMNMPV